MTQLICFFLFVLFWVLGVTWGDMEVSYLGLEIREQMKR